MGLISTEMSVPDVWPRRVFFGLFYGVWVTDSMLFWDCLVDLVLRSWKLNVLW